MQKDKSLCNELLSNNATANTGNIAKQTITFAGQTSPFVQTYKYDSLNRITEAKETSGSATTWQQNYSYDRYGNRIDFAQSVGGNQLAINNQTLPQVDSVTNRFLANQGYLYDNAGNIVSDQTPAGTRNFTFNGDNKQTEIRDPAVAVSPSNPDNNVIGKYYYDGEGKRVKKVTATEVTVFVYSAGKLAEEYSTEAPPATPTTNYVHTDTLQSVRAVSDKLGNIISRRDFMPYGEELTAGAAGRLATDKYTNGADSVRQRFTGYEKDQETGLDFAEARYYNNQHGRFTAVDPLLASGKSANPQTFNRYVYTMNSPLLLADPTGMQAGERMYVRGPEGHLHFKLSSSRPKGFREFTGNKTIESDGYLYQVSSHSIIGVGAANRHAKLPRQSISTAKGTTKPFVNTALIDSLADNGTKKLYVGGGTIIGGTVAGVSCWFLCGPAAVGASTLAADHAGVVVPILAGLGGAGAGMVIANATDSGGGGSGGGGLPPELSQQLSDIYKTYNKYSFDCDCAAQDSLSAFKQAGINGEIVEFQDRFGANLLLDNTGKPIAKSGYHQAVKVGDKYYDALTGADGATQEDYYKLFYGDAGEYLEERPPRPFVPRQP